MEHVDLRVREDLVASFVECLTDDLSPSRRAALLDRLADDTDPADAGADDDTPDGDETEN